MSKKKPAPAKVAPSKSEPGYLSFLEAPKDPKEVPPPPLDWLTVPRVEIGKEVVGDPIRRTPGPLLPNTIREVPYPVTPPAQTASASEPLIIWTESKTNLAEKIVDEHRNEIRAGKITQTEVLDREAPRYAHYKQPTKPLSGSSLRNLLTTRRNKQLGRVRH